MNKDDYKVYADKMKKSSESVAADCAAVRAGRFLRPGRGIQAKRQDQRQKQRCDQLKPS